MNFNIIMFIVFGELAIAGGAALFLAKHPIRGALGLLGSMLSLAGMYAILNAHAIAAFQIIIYAGAVMVLITYIIMLLDIRTEDYTLPFSKYFMIGIPLVVILGVIFLVRLMNLDFSKIIATSPVTTPETFGNVGEIGHNLMNKFLFSFEFVSTLLFAAIVAVIALVQLDWKGRQKDES
jgi:NADH-quinone oxidoreductase subunit J